ncbi:leucine-rich repeat-containing protein 3-like [Clupea harengus]|uniref:Leucine-rich repeat-containing protein 3 n=1 Tax=Clupea harengus TaxID=7950 RepID=A0A6P3VN61_CLUHA|nr:leucine-rich repeat-containing protein 3-like [Clupea harengus]
MGMLLRGAMILALLTAMVRTCPKPCHCSERGGLTNVQCSSRDLDAIPDDLPEDTVTLQLSSNHITRVPSQAFSRLWRLQELDLSGNTIEAVEAGAFQGVTESLRVLDLSDNRLRGVPKEAFGRLHAKISLSGNPWHCECVLQEVLRELRLDENTVNEVSCHTAVREEFAGRPIIQVLDSGVNFCSFQRKTTDVAMFITMFGWFAMVIAYVVYYVRQNREDARRHLEYLKALPNSSHSSSKDSDTASTVL